MPKKIDFTGKRFSRLVVVKDTGLRTVQGGIIWQCKCDCGNYKNVNSMCLKNGFTQSCGCLNAERMIKMHESYKEKILVENTSLAMINQGISKANKSGVTGVFWRKEKNKWEANLTFQGKRHLLGYFSKLEDAAKARKLGEEKYFTPILEKYGRLEIER